MKIIFKRVHKNFSRNGKTVPALADVNFTIEDGEFACALGPEGSGKSTLIALAAGFEFPDTGEVFVGTKKVDGPSREAIAVFREDSLFPWLSVLENVEIGLKAAGAAPADRRIRALEALETVHLADRAHAHPSDLTEGQKRRAAIARALVLKPKALLMDEPFAALDSNSRAELRNELKDIRRKNRMTVLFATDDAREAEILADRVIEMGRGSA